MARFHYRAVGRKGDVVTGVLEMPDERAAVALLQDRGEVPIRVARQPASSLRALLDIEITPRDALSARDRVAFTRGLATLLSAGVPLDRALEIARDLSPQKAVRAIAARLLERVREGATLAEALDAESRAFPPLYRSVVHAGEAGAALEATLSRLAGTLEEAEKRASDLRSALIYPAFLLLTSIGSIVVLMTVVVPTFQPLLDDAGVEPPVLTRVVIGMGTIFEEYGVAMLAGLATLLVIWRLVLTLPAARLAWHRALLGLPIAGLVWRKIETGRFARLLGMLLQNGVSLTAALPLVRRAVSNEAVAAEIERITPEVDAGRGLAQPLVEGKVLPPLALQLIEVGQESGQLTEMLLKTAEIFETEAKRDIDNSLALLTPTVILLMGGFVALVVSSILFALFSINELAV